MGTARSRLFSQQQVKRLRNLGLDDAALDCLRHACVVARAQGWFDRPPPKKKDLRDRLELIEKSAYKLGQALSDMPGAIGPELYSRGIKVHELQERLATLIAAAAVQRKSLLTYKDTKAKPTLPVILIARAVSRCVPPTATDTGPFMRVIEVCYEAMCASHEQWPSVRTLRQAIAEMESMLK